MAQQVFTGRYQIVRHLARGGMAEVYLARDLLLDRPVALKVLFPEFSTDPSFVERFRREARAAANLNHPNIVSVYDWGEEGGTYFIVMEYIEGPTLRDVIRGEGPLFPNRAAEIGAEIAAALEFAHRRGVIHRDVKPGNVLISGMVKVTDFGIARAGDPQESLTQTGAVMGTASYFSPEQAQGLPIDNRSDVYSLGVVLYEMVAGRPPFTGDSPVAIAYQHVRENALPPSRHNPDVPPPLDAVVMKAMAKNRDERYASANDLRNDLLRFTHGQPVAAGPLVAAADATQAVAATGVQSSVDGTRVMGGVATPPVVVEEEEAPRKRTGAYFVVLLVLLALLAILLVVFARQLGLGGTSEVVVPSVLGRTEADAVRILTDAGLKARTVTVNDDDPANTNKVIAQEPTTGVELEEDSTVTISVSQGPVAVDVPDVRNRREDTAREVLTAAGFQVEVVERPDDKVPADTVIDQLPAAGNKAPKGSKVTIAVSSGREQVPVPNVAGRDQSEAANILGQAGFGTSTQVESSDTVPNGRVIRTDPSASTPTPKGSTVTVIVSSGPPPTTAPPVVTTAPTLPRFPTTTTGDE
ncbi:MAG TPA: Stk1 family PASTA domain-containing Ser/Thr kinase [Acidimicrobiales bacterium]|nr:Stk1 family PASTA domain-containing Ser/Thr kinase [Acidimicrobiales bacterium]